MTSPLLSMNAIYKSFGGVPALSEASLEVMPAEVMAIVGQNGAGKSTMIKIINGHYVRDSGSISFNGAPWTAGSTSSARPASSISSGRSAAPRWCRPT